MTIAIALDVDHTMTTADPAAMRRLHDLHANDLYVNTAREASYCVDPDSSTTRYVPQSRHTCRPRGGHPVEWKVRNLMTIADDANTSSSCTVLIDDRPENLFGVRSHGFVGIQVNPETGITHDTVDQVLEIAQRCKNPKKMK